MDKRCRPSQLRTRSRLPATERPAPRWAMRLAYALPLLVLPKLINERCRYTRTKPCERRVALAAGRGGQAAHDQVG